MYRQKLAHLRPKLFPSSDHHFPQYVFFSFSLCSDPLFSKKFILVLALLNQPKGMDNFFWYIYFSLSFDTPSPLSHQPDLHYSLSLGMRSPLVISQSQTPKAHIIMGNIKRTAMTSTFKLSTITFGFASYCELYFSPSDTHRLIIYRP